MTGTVFRSGKRTRPLTWLMLGFLVVIGFIGPCLCNQEDDDSWYDEDDEYEDDDCQDDDSCYCPPCDAVVQSEEQEPEYKQAYLSLLRSQSDERTINSLNMVLYNTSIKQIQVQDLSSEHMALEIRRQWAAVNDLPETEYRALRCFWLAMFAVKYELPEAPEMVYKCMEKMSQVTTLEYAQPSQECPEGWYMAWLKFHQSQHTPQLLESLQ